MPSGMPVRQAQAVSPPRGDALQPARPHVRRVHLFGTDLQNDQALSVNTR